MTRLVFMLMAFFLAMPILYFFPLGLTVTGSFLLLSIALLIAGGSFFIEPYVPIWQNFLVCFLLVATVAYFLSKYRGHKVISEGLVNKKERASEDRLVTREKVIKKRKEEKQLEKVGIPLQKDALFETKHDKTIGQPGEENEPLYINEEIDELDLEVGRSYEKEELKPVGKGFQWNRLETKAPVGEKAASAEENGTWEADLESLLTREEELPVFEKNISDENSELDSHDNENYYLESLFDEIVEEEKSSLPIAKVKETSLEQERELAFENKEEQDYITPFDHLDFDEMFGAEETAELEESKEARKTISSAGEGADLDKLE
ncbi:MAG TPA: hypothetical protein VIR64_07240 [Pseudobacillus sp.]